MPFSLSIKPIFFTIKNITEPAGTERFINRNLDQLGLIKEGDACHKAFTSRGWEWGGSWIYPDYPDCPIDYMHFQKFLWYASKPKPKY